MVNYAMWHISVADSAIACCTADRKPCLLRAVYLLTPWHGDDTLLYSTTNFRRIGQVLNTEHAQLRQHHKRRKSQDTHCSVAAMVRASNRSCSPKGHCGCRRHAGKAPRCALLSVFAECEPPAFFTSNAAGQWQRSKAAFVRCLNGASGQTKACNVLPFTRLTW